MFLCVFILYVYLKNKYTRISGHKHVPKYHAQSRSYIYKHQDFTMHIGIYSGQCEVVNETEFIHTRLVGKQSTTQSDFQ